MATAYRVPGPCTIKFNSVTLGVSKNGCRIRSRTTWTPVTDDAHGTEPADFIFTGKAAQIEVIALDTVAVKAANIWGDYGGIFMGVTGGLAAIGALASVIGKRVDIIERGGVYTWTALCAVPIDPDLDLESTRELQIPVSFLIVPDVNGKLFSTFPAYIV